MSTTSTFARNAFFSIGAAVGYALLLKGAMMVGNLDTSLSGQYLGLGLAAAGAALFVGGVVMMMKK